MDHIEQKLHEQMENGEALMDYLSEVHEKLNIFCLNNNIKFRDIEKAIRMFNRMNWPEKTACCPTCDGEVRINESNNAVCLNKSCGYICIEEEGMPEECIRDLI